MTVKDLRIISPDKIFKKVKKWFQGERKLAFLVTFISGIIIHFQLYSQEITNPDGLWNIIYKISGTWEVSLGRWGIAIFDTLRGGLVSPIISSFISIFIMALISISIVELFSIKNKIAIVIASIALASMPTFSTILTYWYCSDSYTFSILSSILAVYFVYRSSIKKKLRIYSRRLIFSYFNVFVSKPNRSDTYLMCNDYNLRYTKK